MKTRPVSRFIDKVRVKGKNVPVDLYEVYSANPPRLQAQKRIVQDDFEQATGLYREASPTPLSIVDLLVGGKAALETANRSLGLALSPDEIDYLATLATWVHPHNRAGRLYLKAILPFHILIARDALARVGAEASPAASP